MWKSVGRPYPDGTPRTKRVTTNAIMEVDEIAGTAAYRSYYTVSQQTDNLPLQAIVAGRYDDRFVRVEGQWRFSHRDYRPFDLIGDVSQHLMQPIFAPVPDDEER